MSNIWDDLSVGDVSFISSPRRSSNGSQKSAHSRRASTLAGIWDDLSVEDASFISSPRRSNSSQKSSHRSGSNGGKSRRSGSSSSHREKNDAAILLLPSSPPPTFPLLVPYPYTMEQISRLRSAKDFIISPSYVPAIKYSARKQPSSPKATRRENTTAARVRALRSLPPAAFSLLPSRRRSSSSSSSSKSKSHKIPTGPRDYTVIQYPFGGQTYDVSSKQYAQLLKLQERRARRGLTTTTTNEASRHASRSVAAIRRKRTKGKFAAPE